MVNDILHLLVSQAGVQRQTDLIGVVGLGIGEMGDVKAQILVSGVHGQGLVVDIAGDAPLGHFGDDLIALLRSDTGDPGQIQMTGGLVLFAVMLQNLDTQRL